MSFEDIVQRFDLNPYLVVTASGQRVSSFTSGTPGALVFFWQAPTPTGATEGRTYLVQTQAPHAIELIQQAVQTGVDGQFGDATRTAIINDARAHGVDRLHRHHIGAGGQQQGREFAGARAHVGHHPAGAQAQGRLQPRLQRGRIVGPPAGVGGGLFFITLPRGGMHGVGHR